MSHDTPIEKPVIFHDCIVKFWVKIMLPTLIPHWLNPHHTLAILNPHRVG